MRQECDTRDIKETKSSAVVTDGMKLSGRREDCSGPWARGQEQLQLEGSGSHFPYAEGIEVHCMCEGLMCYVEVLPIQTKPNTNEFGKNR